MAAKKAKNAKTLPHVINWKCPFPFRPGLRRNPFLSIQSTSFFGKPLSMFLTKHYVIFLQFKVLRRGCWEKINFRKARAQLNIGNESHLFSNPWIKHFMQSSNDQELADVQSSSPQGSSVLPSEAIYTQRRKCRTMNCRLAMSSDHPLSHHSDKHDQDFDDSNAGSFLLQPSGVWLSVKYNLPFPCC